MVDSGRYSGPKLEPNALAELVLTRMPFSKYSGYWMIDLPAAYLLWFEKNGFPQGKIGEQLQLLHVLKMTGNGDVLRTLHQQLRGNPSINK